MKAFPDAVPCRFHRVDYFWKVQFPNENYYTLETFGHVQSNCVVNFVAIGSEIPKTVFSRNTRLDEIECHYICVGAFGLTTLASGIW